MKLPTCPRAALANRGGWHCGLCGEPIDDIDNRRGWTVEVQDAPCAERGVHQVHARCLAARGAARLAALEAFAAAFADAEWQDEVAGKDWTWKGCRLCAGVEPAEYDACQVAKQEPGCHRGHRPDCARGQAVARVKETA